MEQRREEMVKEEVWVGLSRSKCQNSAWKHDRKMRESENSHNRWRKEERSWWSIDAGGNGSMKERGETAACREERE